MTGGEHRRIAAPTVGADLDRCSPHHSCSDLTEAIVRILTHVTMPGYVMPHSAATA